MTWCTDPRDFIRIDGKEEEERAQKLIDAGKVTPKPFKRGIGTSIFSIQYDIDPVEIDSATGNIIAKVETDDNGNDVLSVKKQTSKFTRSYNGFSGVGMKCYIGDLEVGELQACSYNISREMTPIYTIGSKDPRSLARGKRAIAGSLILAKVNKENLHKYLEDKNFYNFDGYVPEMDIVLEARNEHGHLSKMEIQGCELMNNGYGIPIMELIEGKEKMFTFAAKQIIPWVTQDSNSGLMDSVQKLDEVKEEDEHAGMVYNPISDTWSWF